MTPSVLLPCFSVRFCITFISSVHLTRYQKGDYRKYHAARLTILQEMQDFDEARLGYELSNQLEVSGHGATTLPAKHKTSDICISCDSCPAYLALSVLQAPPAIFVARVMRMYNQRKTRHVMQTAFQ